MPNYNSSTDTYTDTINTSQHGMSGNQTGAWNDQNNWSTCPQTNTYPQQSYGTVYVDESAKNQVYAELIPLFPYHHSCPECGVSVEIKSLNLDLTCRFCESKYTGDFRMEAAKVAGNTYFFSVIEGVCSCCRRENSKRASREVKCGGCKNKFRVDLPKMDAMTRRVVTPPIPGSPPS